MDQKLRAIIETETKEELKMKKANAWSYLIDEPQKLEEVIADICCRVMKAVKNKYKEKDVKAGVLVELKKANRANDLAWLRALGGLRG